MKRARITTILILASVLAFSGANGQSRYRSVQSGNWDDVSTWECYIVERWGPPSSPPSGSEEIEIQSGNTVTVDHGITVSNLTVEGQLTVAAGQTLTVTGGGEVGGLSLNGTLLIEGTLDATGGSTYANGGSSVIYAGSIPQTVAPITYYDLQINNPTGADLISETEADGSVDVSQGNLRTGSNTLTLGSSASIVETAPYSVIGKLTTARACTTGVNQNFGGLGVEINKSAGPSPVGVTVTRSTGTPSSIAGATSVKRYFDISAPTDLNAEFVFHYRTDELNGAIESNLQLFKSTDGGSTWSNMSGAVSTSAHTVTLTGIDSFSKWTAASPLPAPTLTSISPSTGVIGNTLNMTITGANFGLGATSVSFSGGGITVNSVTVNSSAQLTANITITSSASATYRDVSVTNTYGTGTYSNAFEVLNPAPTLASVSPATGVAGQSLAVTVQGSGFVPGTTNLSFGAGITVNSISVTNDNSLTAQISIAPGASAGPRTITATNPTPGGGTATLAAAFTVIPMPTLASVSPDSGTRGQALSVILTGTNFVAGVTTVNFGSGISADTVTVLSGTQVKAVLTISLAASTGARDVSVSNSGPSGFVTLAGGFSVTNPAPTITSVVPSVGARGKPVNITINGSGFISGVTSASPVAGLTFVSAMVVSLSQITGTISVARDAALGLSDLTIVNAGPGGGPATLTNAFEVQNPAPTASSVSPSAGTLGQTLSVVVTGTDFLNGVSTVDFGTGITVNSTSINPAGTQITANITISSATTAGTRTVTVTNSPPGGGSAVLTDAFTVQNLAPTLTSINPAAGARGQTMNVALTGTNFGTGITSASFGVGVTVNSLTVNTPTSATANITIAPSAVVAARSVTVTNAPPGGGSATLSFVFNVGNPAPTLTSISPTSGARGQTSLSVTLNGTNFLDGVSTVSFGSEITVNSIAVTNASQITANVTIPISASLGSKDVSVTNAAPGGGTAVLSSAFAVNNPAPTLTSIAPTSGNMGQPLSVILNGTNFLSGVTTVSFGPDITVNSVTFNTINQITANITVGAGAASGGRNVTVTNAGPGGGSAALSGGFTVTYPAPTIASIAPTSAGRGSLINVTVIGTQFINGVTSVSFGADISLTSTTIKSATEILVNISIASGATTGQRTVTVTNAGPGGGPASLTNAFTITSGLATEVIGDLGVVPDQYVLQEAYPNPFNPSTRIRFGLPEDSRVRLDVHNMLGNIVAELVRGERSKGLYELQWHPDNLPSGIYLIRIYAESTESTRKYIASRKVVLVK